MDSRFLNIFFSAIFLAMIVSLGCEQKVQDKRPKAIEKLKPLDQLFDASLAKISGPAAIMQAEIKLNREAKCLASEVFKDLGQAKGNTVSLKEEKKLQDLLSRVSVEQKQKCDFFVIVDDATAPIFSLIKKSGELPKVAYSFTVLLPSDSSEHGECYRSVEIGLFEVQGECIRCEDMARSIGLPTTTCKVWTP